jgi:hypothetical protein
MLQWLHLRSRRLALQAQRRLLSDELHPDLEGEQLCTALSFAIGGDM